MPVQFSISVLVIPVAVSVMVTQFIGIILGLLCGIKYMQKKLMHSYTRGECNETYVGSFL